MLKWICKSTGVAEGGSVSFGLHDIPVEHKRLVIDAFSSNNPTTITVFVSYDNGRTWVAAGVSGTDAAASISLDGEGVGQAVELVPAPNIKLVSSAACKLTAYAYISN
jgi:hypothetical protein